MRFKTFLEVYGSSFNYKVPSDKETLLYDFYMVYNLSGISDSLTDRVGKMRRSGADIPPGADKWSQGGEPETTPEDKIDYTIKEVRSKILPKLKQDLLEAVFFSICAESRHIFDNNTPQKVLQVVEDKFGPEGKDLVRRYSKYYYQQSTVSLANLARPINDVPSRQVSPSVDQDSYVKSFKGAMKATGSDLADKFTTNEEQAKFVKIFQYLFFAADDDEISAYRKARSAGGGYASKPSTQTAWNSSYGGLPWADICRGWLELLNAKTENQMMVQIDHVYDLQHNTSTVFNKLNSYVKSGGHGWVKKALDFKAHIKEPHELVKRVSPAMRKLALMALKIKTGRTLEDYEKDKNKPEIKSQGASEESPISDENLTPEQQQLKELHAKVSSMASNGDFAFTEGRRAARTMVISKETPSGVRNMNVDEAYTTAQQLFGIHASHKDKFYNFVNAEKTNMETMSVFEGANINAITKDLANDLFSKLNINTAFRPKEIILLQNQAKSLFASDKSSLNQHAIALVKFIKTNISPYTLSIAMLYAKAFLLLEWGRLNFPSLSNPSPVIKIKDDGSEDKDDDSKTAFLVHSITDFMHEHNLSAQDAIARFAFNGKWKPKQVKDVCNTFWPGSESMVKQVLGMIASHTKNFNLMKNKTFNYSPGDVVDNVFTGDEEDHIKNILKFQTNSENIAAMNVNINAYIRIILNLPKDDLGIHISNFYREWFVNKLQPKTTTTKTGKYTPELIAIAKSIAKYLVGKPADIIGRLIAGTNLDFDAIVNGIYGGNQDIKALKTTAESYAKQEVKNIQILNHFAKQMEIVLTKKTGYQNLINAMKEQGFKMQLPMELTIKVGNFDRFQKALGYSPAIATLYKNIIEIINENFNDLL